MKCSQPSLHPPKNLSLEEYNQIMDDTVTTALIILSVLYSLGLAFNLHCLYKTCISPY